MFNSYKKIASTLPTCTDDFDLGGRFAFYDAVQILKKLNPGLPSVALPKLDMTQRRKADKWQLNCNIKLNQSKQSNDPDLAVLAYLMVKRSVKSEDMKNLISRNNYTPVSFNGDFSSASEKLEFIKICINNNWPILVPYRRVYYTSWLIIIGIDHIDNLTFNKYKPKDKNKPAASDEVIKVIFPESPREHREAHVDGLLVANSSTSPIHSKFIKYNKISLNSALDDAFIAVTPKELDPDVEIKIRTEEESKIWKWIPKSFKCW